MWHYYKIKNTSYSLVIAMTDPYKGGIKAICRITETSEAKYRARSLYNYVDGNGIENSSSNSIGGDSGFTVKWDLDQHDVRIGIYKNVSDIE